MSQRTPAPLPPKPGKVKVFRAMFPYVAQQPDELSFDEGDLLFITDQPESSGWWKGKCGPKSGLIPSNYVTESAESITYPLHDAAKRGNIPFLKECLANDVSVNSLDKSSSTALYWAAHSGSAEAVQILLTARNVSIDSQNKLGDTALHAAAWKGNTVCAQKLLEAGCKTTIRNLDKKTAMDLANNPETAALLKRYAQPVVSSGDYEGSSDEESD